MRNVLLPGALVVGLLLTIGTGSYARGPATGGRFNSLQGRYIGRADASRPTGHYYDANGYVGRSYTSGGTTRFYDRGGSYLGRQAR